MPISEEFINTDKKSYQISMRLDIRIKNFLDENSILVKKQDRNLKEILNLCNKINEIFHGFDNPPREILEELTVDGLNALKEYFAFIKKDILKRTNLKIILGYEAIRLAHEFWQEIPKYLFSIEEKQSSNSSLADIEMVFLNINEEKNAYKNTLLKSKNITSMERMYLYNYLESEIDNLVINRVVQIYANKLNNKIQKDVVDFCIIHSIPLKTSDLNKKILISFQVYTQIQCAKKMLDLKFGKYKNAGIENINDEQKKLENNYLISAMSKEELELIVNFINKLLSNLSEAKSKMKIRELTDNAQNDYKGQFQKEVVDWIRLLNQDILRDGYNEKIVDKYMLRVEYAN